MKKILVLLLFVAFQMAVVAQGVKLHEYYISREINASPELKAKLAAARQEIAAKNLQYVVGFTSKAELPLEKITGEKQVSAEEELKLFDKLKNQQLKLRNTLKINPYLLIKPTQDSGEGAGEGSGYIYGNPTQSKLDLRAGGLVTPVKDQGGYGNCWSFGAMAAYEGNFKVVNNAVINTSEQYVVNCSGAGNSSGGLAYQVLDWMVDNNKNVADESTLAYSGPDGSCPAGTPATDYYAVNWGVIDPSGDPGKIPTVAQIKEAMCKYGVISASVNATYNFKIYAGGVFNESPSNYSSPTSNHAIALVGWDDATQCWLLKNSWGTDWGETCGYGTERGYMWIKYNTNNVGRRGAWVQAKQRVNFPFKNGVKWHNFFCIGNEIPKVGDFNGDGKDDIVTFTRGSAADVFVALSDGTKFNGSGVKWHDNFCINSEIPLTGDFNGDGKDDIVTFTRGSAADVYVALSDGTKFNGTGAKWHDNFCMGTEIPLVGDFNGDGKDDIATFTGGTSGDVYVALSDGAKFNGTGVKWHDNFCFGTEIPLTGDFNGDGKCDIAVFNRGTNGDVFVALSDGTKFNGTGVKWHDNFCFGTEMPAVGDYTGDKKCDIVTFLLNKTGDAYGATSNGAKFIGTAIKVHEWFGLTNEIPMMGDFNGDKKADLITFLRDTQPEPGRADVYVGLAK